VTAVSRRTIGLSRCCSPPAWPSRPRSLSGHLVTYRQ